MSKKEFIIPELNQLKIENSVLKLKPLEERARQLNQAMNELNQQYRELAVVRNERVEEARREVEAPENWVVTADCTRFVPPPPPPKQPNEDGSDGEGEPKE